MEHGAPWLGHAHFIEVIESRIVFLLSELTLENIDKTTDSIAKVGNLVNTKTLEAFQVVANVIYNYATGNLKMDKDSENITACATLCNRLDQFIQQNVSGESLYVDDDGYPRLRLQLLKQVIRQASCQTFQKEVLDQKVDETVNIESSSLVEDPNKKELRLQIMRFTGELFKLQILTGSDMYSRNIAVLMARKRMSFLLLDQHGSSRDRGIESVCVLLEGIGSSIEDKLIDQVYTRLEKLLENNHIQLEIRGRMETVCGFWRQRLSITTRPRKASDANFVSVIRAGEGS